MEPLDSSDQKTTSAFPISQRWGLIMAAAMIVSGLLMFVVGIDAASGSTASKIWGWISNTGITLFCVWQALEYHRDHELGGYLTHGRAMGVGTLIGLIAGILWAIWQFLFTTFIDSEFTNRLLQAATEQMERDGMPDGQIEQAIPYMKMFMSPAALSSFVVISSVIFGFIAGLILGVFMKKERPYMN